MRAICLLFLLALPSWAQDIVHVGTGVVLPPYVITETKSGLELDIVRAALVASNLKMEVGFYPPARALYMVRNKTLDAVTTVNEGAGSEGFFSDSHISYHNFAITLKDSDIQLRKVEDLAGHSIAAFQNARLFLGPAYVNAINMAQYQEYPDQLTQNKLMYSRRVEVVIADRLIFEFLNRKLGTQFNTQQALQYSDIFPPTTYKVLFNNAKLRDQFNQGLAKIRANGEYQQILRKYNKDF